MHKNVKNLTGQHFGNLTVISFAGTDKNRHSLWRCRCECGNEVVVLGVNLENGDTKSCGCLRQTRGHPRKTHGYPRKTHGYSRSPTYRSWSTMIARSKNPNYPKYADYGGRGIIVCERWLIFENFLADMGERPEGHSLHRIDNDGNYEPGNCKWATAKEQALVKRNNRYHEWNGQNLTEAEWSEITGIHRATLNSRINDLGWSVEKALTTPVRKWRRDNR